MKKSTSNILIAISIIYAIFINITISVILYYTHAPRYLISSTPLLWGKILLYFMFNLPTIIMLLIAIFKRGEKDEEKSVVGRFKHNLEVDFENKNT